MEHSKQDLAISEVRVRRTFSETFTASLEVPGIYPFGLNIFIHTHARRKTHTHIYTYIYVSLFHQEGTRIDGVYRVWI